MTAPPRTSWWDTAAVVVIAAIVAAPALGSPDRLVFDESYYVMDAVAQLDTGLPGRFQAHPPLGTWLIAAGVALVDGPVGWRISVLLLGLLAVAWTHRLAGRLHGGTTVGRVVAATAALLLVSDGSWLVLTRTSMLDGPLTTFVVGGVLAAVAAAQADSAPRRRQWLLAAGLAIGAATAVKWSGALGGLAVLGVLAVVPFGPVAPRLRTAVVRGSAVGAVALAVYAVSWIPFALTRADVPVTDCSPDAAPCATEGGIAGVIDQHRSLVRFHTSLTAVGVGETSPAGWPLMQEPFGIFRPGCNIISDPALGRPPGRVLDCDSPVGVDEDVIRYVGNPVVWIGFLTLVPLLSVSARRGDRAAAVALLCWSVQWLPWLAATRTSYIWYMAPTVPFAALGIASAARLIAAVNAPRAVMAGFAGGVVGGLLGAVTPWGVVAGAIIGWGLAPLVLAAGSSRGASPLVDDGADGSAGAATDVVDDRAPTQTAGSWTTARPAIVALGAFVVAAGVTAAVMRPDWVVSPDAEVDRVSTPAEARPGQTVRAPAQADSAAGGT